MNREEIIRIAGEAGWKDLRNFDADMRDEIYMGDDKSLERFAALVVAHEREKCAKNCEGTGMTGYKIGMAEEAVIADLTAKLAECQAREAKLREALEYMIAEAKLTGFQYEVCRQAVNEPQDDTALKEYRKEVLLEAANAFEEKVYSTEDGHLHSEYHAADELRRMAEE